MNLSSPIITSINSLANLLNRSKINSTTKCCRREYAFKQLMSGMECLGSNYFMQRIHIRYQSINMEISYFIKDQHSARRFVIVSFGDRVATDDERIWCGNGGTANDASFWNLIT